MRTLCWSVFLVPLALGCTGDGKSDLEKLKEECLSSCSNFITYVERCDFELGASTEGFCEDTCSEWNDLTAESECEDDYATFLDCSASVNWAGAECTEEGMVEKSMICADKQNAWMECVNDGVADDTGGTPEPEVDPDADDDGDGWTNSEEEAAGTNPDYVYSHPYAGGYNVGFCETPPETTGPTGYGTMGGDGTVYEWSPYQLGDVPENFTLLDQHGEMVDLYSFCGKHIVFAVGAGWCGPCRGVAETLQAEQDLYRDSNVQFIEIISGDNSNNPPDQAFLESWHTEYGFTDIPVLGLVAQDQSTWEAYSAHLSMLFDTDGYIPSVWQLDTTTTIVSADEGNSDPSSFLD